MENEIYELLRKSKREGIEELIAYLQYNDFGNAPASAVHHNNVAGGLCKHTMLVYETMRDLAVALDFGQEFVSAEQVIITAICHDIGKLGSPTQPMYVRNFLKSGKIGSKPYVINTKLLAYPHEIRSCLIAEKFITLTEEETYAIMYHATSLGEMKYSYSKPTALLMLLFFADYWSSQILERGVREDEC